jgi:hypothetical protein
LLPSHQSSSILTLNPTAFAPLSSGSFAYHPRLGHRARPWTLSSPTSLVVNNTRCEFSCFSLPSYTSFTSSRARLPPTFRLSARHLCCFPPPPPQTTINVYPTGVLPTPLLTQPPSHSTPFYPTPCYPSPCYSTPCYPTPTPCCPPCVVRPTPYP